MTQYEQQDLEQKLSVALESLMKNDLFLLQNDVNERSISHKLAEYLQFAFPEWHVDCEYNRNYNRKKKLDFALPNEPIDSLKARTVYPDIIVHRRNTDHNLLAIEIKKESNIKDDDEEKDKNKLRAFLGNPYKYKYGVFIAFASDGTPRLDWFPAE